MLIVFIITVFYPINTYANYHPIFEQGDGALVKSFNKAAVVGKVIEWNDEKQKYIVYGRLSADAGTGYKVYHTGMFFLAEPNGKKAKEEVEKLISQGKGVKLFGRYASSFDSETILYFSTVEEYKPELDATVGLKPAYSSSEPISWVGFGIHRHIANSLLSDLKTTPDFVNSLYPFMKSLKVGNKSEREILEDKGQAYLIEGTTKFTPIDFKPVFKNDVYRDETPKVVPNLSNDKKEAHRLYLTQIKNKYPLYNVDFLLRNNNTNNESLNALGGTVFVKALKGESNYYLKTIPVTRPDIDRFLIKLEGKKISSFSEWADSGLFYGSIKPIYTTIYVGGKTKEIYSHAEFTGSYFPANRIDEFIDTIEGYSKEVLEKIPYNYSSKEEEDKFRNKENWVVRGMDEATALRLEKGKHTWLSGARFLTYRLPCYCSSPDCPGYYDVTVDYGNMKDDPEATLINRDMTYDKEMTKAEMNFTLSVLREFVF